MAIEAQLLTPTPKARSVHVPVELWFDILARPNLRSDLKQVSLTCHTFRVAAQSVLCEHLVVPSLTVSNAFRDHLARFLASGHVVGRVKSVTIGNVGTAVAETPLDVAKHFARHLDTKSSDFYHPGLVTPKEVRSLLEASLDNTLFHSIAHLRNLTTLLLSGLTLGPQEISWLSMVPKLSRLHVEKCVLYLGNSYETTAAIDDFKLKTLTIIECRISQGILEVLTSPNTLEELTILSIFYMDLTLDVEVFPCLRYLQVPVQWSQTTLALLPRCPALEVLKLREWGSYGGLLFPGPFPPPRGFRMQTLPENVTPLLKAYYGRIDDAWSVITHRPITRLQFTSVFDTGTFHSWVVPLFRECPQLEDLSFVIRSLDRATVSHLLSTFRQLKTLRVSLRKLTGQDMDQVSKPMKT